MTLPAIIDVDGVATSDGLLVCWGKATRVRSDLYEVFGALCGDRVVRAEVRISDAGSNAIDVLLQSVIGKKE